MKVLFVCDDLKDLQTLKVILQDRCLLQYCAFSERVIEQIRSRGPDAVLLDISSGLEAVSALLAELRGEPRAPGIIVFGSVCDPELVTTLIKRGADYYVLKPYTAALLLEKLAAINQERISHPVAVVAETPDGQGLYELIGDSGPIRELRGSLPRLAETDLPLLLEGETGTGKELVARALHRLSPRADGPLLPVNCGAIPENLFESELFGVVRGAYTGAESRAGYFESAHRGTLFLDEVGELSLSAQVTLLRAIETQEIRRVGSTRSRKVDVRILVATNRNLATEVANGRFRADLYYRLRVLHYRIPPLRERAADIPILAAWFLQQLAIKPPLDPYPRGFAPGAVTKLMNHPWPGNVRELRNVVQRAVVACDEPQIQVRHIEFG